MNALRSRLTAITLSALFAGCGAMQSALRLTPTSIARNVAHVSRGTSWMLPEAKNEDLLYLIPGDSTEITIYDYLTGVPVGTLAASSMALNLCSDNLGDIYVVNSGRSYSDNTVVVYAHGASKPTRTLNVPNDYAATACSVDPGTGDLAVAAEYEFANTPPAVLVYPKARGKPKSYAATGRMFETESVTYAAKHDIVLLGYETALTSTYRYDPVFDLLPHGRKALHRIRESNGNRIHDVALGWDGTYLTTIGYNLSQYKLNPRDIRRVSNILDDTTGSNYFCLVPKYGQIVLSDDATNSVETYDYPSGTYINEFSVEQPSGIAFSPAPSRTRIR